MKRFRDLSSVLDRPPASHADDTQSVDVEAEDTRYRRLVEDWNGVVEEVRKIEGLSCFLLPPMFADLQEAARDGPIIVLVASRSSCDAIIVPHQQPPTSIQLPTNLIKLTQLVIALQEAIGKDAGPKGKQTALIKALRKLWDDVVRPVVENLGGFARRVPEYGGARRCSSISCPCTLLANTGQMESPFRRNIFHHTRHRLPR
jgi:hypothetical protein